MQGRREPVLGGEAVVDRHHDGTGIGGHEHRPDMLRLDTPDDEPPAVDEQDAGPRRRTALRSVHAHRYLGVAHPPRDEPVIDLERLGFGQLHAYLGDELLERGACRDGVVEVEGRYEVDERGQLRVDHVWSLPDAAMPRPTDYFGCIRMPASMRIDSAFT